MPGRLGDVCDAVEMAPQSAPTPRGLSPAPGYWLNGFIPLTKQRNAEAPDLAIPLAVVTFGADPGAPAGRAGPFLAALPEAGPSAKQVSVRFDERDLETESWLKH
jgi:hypothetical protein